MQDSLETEDEASVWAQLQLLVFHHILHLDQVPDVCREEAENGSCHGRQVVPWALTYHRLVGERLGGGVKVHHVDGPLGLLAVPDDVAAVGGLQWREKGAKVEANT